MNEVLFLFKIYGSFILNGKRQMVPSVCTFAIGILSSPVITCDNVELAISKSPDWFNLYIS